MNETTELTVTDKDNEQVGLMKISDPNESIDVLTGRVAQILSERELVITVGSNNGVAEGMIFAVLAKTPTEIFDPETNELLDVIDREKVRVKVSEVRDKVSICKTFVTKFIAGGSLYGVSALNEIFKPPQRIVETLRVDDGSLPPPLSPEESYVKINDRVILLISD